MLKAAARWARCRSALAGLDAPAGITGADFLMLVADAVGKRIHLFEAPDLVRTEDRVGEAVRIEGALVISYDASLRDAPLDNTLFHEGAHILLGHLDDASAGGRLQALHSTSRCDGQRPVQARSQLPAGVGRGRWELEMERDAETMAQMLMLRRNASPRTSRVAALRLRSA
ncbi:hypothetical protein [Kineococcus indalonis]|uniref:hypothetical protein n=1 Tax=Kineococcus indalonis TaxID=2696566 RepID=UPI0014136981|nr:hypothetical protein [Kineococcus indalonis]NAZ84571.1 hypothetical protein [Kineococcus indalonis]